MWGPPSHGPRSQVLARELGITSLHFIYRSTRRGAVSAPFRYGYQAAETLRRLWRERPEVVFVQSPPSLAVLSVYIYCQLTGASYLIDAHSAALLQRVWMWPRWTHRILLRRALVTMVTNEHFERMIRAEGGRAFVLRDIPTVFGRSAGLSLQGKFRLAVVNTFSEDEPLAEILKAAGQLPEVDFYVTGKSSRAPEGTFEHVPANVHFTDFLPDEAYYGLLNSADGVMCLTTRNYTMQRGACEALSLGKPIITSNTPLLQSYFDRGTVHVDNTAEGIRQGVIELQRDLARYQVEISNLQMARRQEWQEKKQALLQLVESARAA